MPDHQSGPKGGAGVPVGAKAGEVLLRQGDLVAQCLVVKSGQVELFRTIGGQQQRVALLRAGDLFGEAALLGDRSSPVGARVLTDATIVAVDGPAFAEVVRQRPEVGLLALRRIAARAAAETEAWAALVAAAADPARQTTREAPSPAGARAALSVPLPSAGVTGPRLIHAETATIFALPDRGEALVGRADPRTKFHPDVELSKVDSQRSLSRRHARITRPGGGFAVVEEPRVANGTFVNGRRLAPGVAAPLAEGDEVCFGLIRMIFRAT